MCFYVTCFVVLWVCSLAFLASRSSPHATWFWAWIPWAHAQLDSGLVGLLHVTLGPLIGGGLFVYYYLHLHANRHLRPVEKRMWWSRLTAGFLVFMPLYCWRYVWPGRRSPPCQ
jgi:hypothetical protein